MLKHTKKNNFPLRVVELFAGVGGFRLGLEKIANRRAFEFIWSNQYEPGSRMQWASEVYKYQFPDTEKSKHSNKLIEDAITSGEVPKKFDLLVGGFPCQDYSVAKPKNHSRGINGKKGVLWWSIYEILKNSKPEYIILENVDRLIKSPSKQRGRDFAIMLKCLAALGYIVEWRVINAAEYGMPQRRRRVFIVASKLSSKLGKITKTIGHEECIYRTGVLAEAFPVRPISLTKGSYSKKKKLNVECSKHTIELEPHKLTELFNKGNSIHAPFMSAGLMIPTENGAAEVWTSKVIPNYKGKSKNLGNILINQNEVPEEFLINKESVKNWVKQKKNKNEIRTNYLTTFEHVRKLFANVGTRLKLTNSLKYALRKQLESYREKNPSGGQPLKLYVEGSTKSIEVTWKLINETKTEYHFKEGPLPMPDPLNRPLRTIITSEGNSSPSRFKHIICRDCAAKWRKNNKVLEHKCVEAKNFRRLTPLELERGNMFPDNHTKYIKIKGEVKEVSSQQRAFFMGNALVVGVVKKIGESLFKKIQA